MNEVDPRSGPHAKSVMSRELAEVVVLQEEAVALGSNTRAKKLADER